LAQVRLQIAHPHRCAFSCGSALALLELDRIADVRRRSNCHTY
jgi:hypothetical protein